jgi:hypothetical protein
VQPFAVAREGAEVASDGLEAAEISLRTRFGKDWFERMWETRWPHVVSGLMVCWGCWGAFAAGWAWWEAVTPLGVWWLGAAGIPEQFLGRPRGVPSWAMPGVQLDEHERRVLAGFMASNPKARRWFGGSEEVSTTGKHVWMLKQQTVLLRSLRESVGKMGSGVSR